MCGESPTRRTSVAATAAQFINTLNTYLHCFEGAAAPELTHIVNLARRTKPPTAQLVQQGRSPESGKYTARTRKQ